MTMSDNVVTFTLENCEEVFREVTRVARSLRTLTGQADALKNLLLGDEVWTSAVTDEFLARVDWNEATRFIEFGDIGPVDELTSVVTEMVAEEMPRYRAHWATTAGGHLAWHDVKDNIVDNDATVAVLRASLLDGVDWSAVAKHMQAYV